MTKRRDAGTGQYISEEEAKSKPFDTWVEETSASKQEFLKDLYEQLLAKADGDFVTTQNIKKVFKEAGLKL